MAKNKLIVRETQDYKRLKLLFKKLKHNPYVKEGYPSEDKKATKKKRKKEKVTNLFLAVVHEFGAPEKGKKVIPARPHIKPSFKKKEIQAFADKIANKVMDGHLTLEQGLDQLGLFMLSLHKKRLLSNIPPKLDKKTLARRAKPSKPGKKPTRSQKTLVDTAHLLNSATIKRIMKS